MIIDFHFTRYLSKESGIFAEHRHIMTKNVRKKKEKRIRKRKRDRKRKK